MASLTSYVEFKDDQGSDCCIDFEKVVGIVQYFGSQTKYVVQYGGHSVMVGREVRDALLKKFQVMLAKRYIDNISDSYGKGQ